MDGWKSILSEFPEKRTTLRGDIDFPFRLNSSVFRISLENSVLFLPVSEFSEFSFLFRMEILCAFLCGGGEPIKIRLLVENGQERAGRQLAPNLNWLFKFYVMKRTRMRRINFVKLKTTEHFGRPRRKAQDQIAR